MTIDGLCKGHPDTEAWFDPARYHVVKAICAQCPLVEACLKDAIDNKEEYGVWGGTTPGERGWKHAEADAYP